MSKRGLMLSNLTYKFKLTFCIDTILVAEYWTYTSIDQMYSSFPKTLTYLCRVSTIRYLFRFRFHIWRLISDGTRENVHLSATGYSVENDSSAPTNCSDTCAPIPAKSDSHAPPAINALSAAITSRNTSRLMRIKTPKRTKAVVKVNSVKVTALPLEAQKLQWVP